MSSLGIYIHIPFCREKCPYCDFYSLTDRSLTGVYTEALLDELKTGRRTEEFTAGKLCEKTITSLYFGGGTPSILGAQELVPVIKTAKNEFVFDCDAEITVECNPSTPGLQSFFSTLAENGVNRVSIGLQSANNGERRALGRAGGADEVKAAVKAAQNAGIYNISLDVMLGIPCQTRESLKNTLDFCIDSGAYHISAYMLKLEKGTRFYNIRDTLELPCEDEVCDSYLFTCDYLSENGLPQYEISNFARKGFPSNHNLLYWNCAEYLGIGAAAHSFINGKRFFYLRSAKDFIDGKRAVYDSSGGSFEEYAMLRLRLTEGLTEAGTLSRFGFSIPDSVRTAARDVPEKYIISDKDGLRLTPEGFLISNSIISMLLTGEQN